VRLLKHLGGPTSHQREKKSKSHKERDTSASGVAQGKDKRIMNKGGYPVEEKRAKKTRRRKSWKDTMIIVREGRNSASSHGASRVGKGQKDGSPRFVGGATA